MEAEKPDTVFGYKLEPGESFVDSDHVACVLVFTDGKPVKVIYPDGRVLPYKGVNYSR